MVHHSELDSVTRPLDLRFRLMLHLVLENDLAEAFPCDCATENKLASVQVEQEDEFYVCSDFIKIHNKFLVNNFLLAWDTI